MIFFNLFFINAWSRITIDMKLINMNKKSRFSDIINNTHVIASDQWEAETVASGSAPSAPCSIAGFLSGDCFLTAQSWAQRYTQMTEISFRTTPVHVYFTLYTATEHKNRRTTARCYSHNFRVTRRSHDQSKHGSYSQCIFSDVWYHAVFQVLREPAEIAQLYRDQCRFPALSRADVGPVITSRYGGQYCNIYTGVKQLSSD